MTTISGSSPTPAWPAPRGNQAGGTAELWRAVQQRIGPVAPPGESAARAARAEAEWDAKKVALVYRVDGAPVYMRDEDGVGVIDSKADAALYNAARAEGETQGLTGQALDVYANSRFEQKMIEKYGDALEIQRFDGTTESLTVGELLAEMLGETAAERLPAARSALVQFYGDSLALLHGDDPAPTR